VWRRLRKKVLAGACEQEVQEVEQVMDEETGLDLTSENVEKVLEEIRPYLVGTGGGELGLLDIDGPIVKVKLSGPAAQVMVCHIPHPCFHRVQIHDGGCPRTPLPP
jgi:hypothetical protein